MKPLKLEIKICNSTINKAELKSFKYINLVSLIINKNTHFFAVIKIFQRLEHLLTKQPTKYAKSVHQMVQFAPPTFLSFPTPII